MYFVAAVVVDGVKRDSGGFDGAMGFARERSMGGRWRGVSMQKDGGSRRVTRVTFLVEGTRYKVPQFTPVLLCVCWLAGSGWLAG